MINLIKKDAAPKVVSHFDADVKIEQTDFSRLSPFPTCIVLAIPRLIGTHEATKPEGLAGIDYSNGWNGAGIAVAAQNERLFDFLGEGIHVIEAMDYGYLGVLDGHHRREMAERNNLVYAITQLFPLIHPNIVIDTWLENFTPLKAVEVQQYFKDQTAVVSAKATKFQIIGSDGQPRRIAHMQPKVYATLNALNGRKK